MERSFAAPCSPSHINPQEVDAHWPAFFAAIARHDVKVVALGAPQAGLTTLLRQFPWKGE